MPTKELDFTSERIKHLEMLENVITRMHNASAALKRYAIIVVGAVAALALRQPAGHDNCLPLFALTRPFRSLSILRLGC